MRCFFWLTGVAALAVMAGCSSARTNMLHRDESNTMWERERHLHGVPITLSVPTHCKVYVTEKHFLIDKSETTVKETKEVKGPDNTVTIPASSTTRTISGIERMALPVVVRDVRHEIIFTDKIFTVDFIRPAAGTFNLDVDFNNQYFKKIQHDVVDETIDDVGNLISKIAPKGVFGVTASNPGEAVSAKLFPVESVVAVGIFEIDSPDFEQQVMAFVNCHVNKSHTALIGPPGVTGAVRLPLPDVCPDCPHGPEPNSMPMLHGTTHPVLPFDNSKVEPEEVETPAVRKAPAVAPRPLPDQGAGVLLQRPRQ